MYLTLTALGVQQGQSREALVDFYYKTFIDVVVANRPNLDKEKLINKYGAKIFPGEVAKTYGYIDESGFSLNQTLKILLQQIDINDDLYQVVELENNNWLASLLKGKELFPFTGTTVFHKIKLPMELDPQILNQFLYYYRTE